MGKIDWNKVAYNVGQMAGDGVNKANDLIDAGERKVRQSIEKYKQTRAEAGQIMHTTQPDTSYSPQGHTGGSIDMEEMKDAQDRIKGWFGPNRVVKIDMSDGSFAYYKIHDTQRHTGGSIDMEEMKDAQDRIKGWFGPNRVVKIDMSDGSFAYYKIHDTQRTEDAVLVMSQILINRLKALAPKTDLINAQDPHEEDVRVIITIDKSSLETGSPSYDDRTVLSEIVATLYSLHAEDSHVLGIETVPYDAEDRSWPWDHADTTKWTLQAAEYRPKKPIN